MTEPTKPSKSDMAVDLVVPGGIDGSSFSDVKSIIRRLRYAEHRRRELEEENQSLRDSIGCQSVVGVAIIEKLEQENLALRDTAGCQEEQLERISTISWKGTDPLLITKETLRILSSVHRIATGEE